MDAEPVGGEGHGVLCMDGSFESRREKWIGSELLVPLLAKEIFHAIWIAWRSGGFWGCCGGAHLQVIDKKVGFALKIFLVRV